MMKFICGTLFNVLMGVILAYVVGYGSPMVQQPEQLFRLVLGNFYACGFCL